jgi:hypothetical protein
MDTLKLDSTTWDLSVDASNNIAVATGPAAIAQDVASSVRVFNGELWYQTNRGVLYLERILGQLPPIGFLIGQFRTAALLVPNVVSVVVALNPLGRDRKLTGSITITDDRGATAVLTNGPDTSAVPWYVSAVSQAAAGNPAGGP